MGKSKLRRYKRTADLRDANAQEKYENLSESAAVVAVEMEAYFQIMNLEYVLQRHMWSVKEYL